MPAIRSTVPASFIIVTARHRGDDRRAGDVVGADEANNLAECKKALTEAQRILNRVNGR
jgi:hypothetical protein